MDPAPTIAIVGRPNVGKSTLFNRLIGKRQAIIAKEAGTTRDRISQKYEIEGYGTFLVDTGGLEYGKQENIESDIQSQAKLAIEDADIILFVIDTIQTLTVDDFTAANILRKANKPVILVANKCDHPNIEQNIFNIYELGLGEPVQVSAIHKRGIEILKDQIIKVLKKLKIKKNRSKKTQENITNICILGKPNAGKSSFVNSLLGEDKIIVSDIPGTTRDAIDTEIIFEKTKYNLIDTAGIRRPGKINRGIEKFSILRALSSVERSDIVVLLIDGTKGLTHQDSAIANLAIEAEKGIIIAINKTDLFKDHELDTAKIARQLQKRLVFIPWAPVVFISAKNKKNTREILKISSEIINEREKRVKTAELNGFLQKIIHKHLPASAKNAKPKFMYGSQVDTKPPKFTLFFKRAKNLHFSYPRYLENEIRKEYGFTGTAIEIQIKESVGQERTK